MDSERPIEDDRHSLSWAFLAALLVGLVALSWRNYLLFHVLVELVAVLVAMSLFLFARATRRFIDHDMFVALGLGYVFVGGLDLAHILSFPGMSVLAGASVNRGAQAWLAGRVLEVLTLLVAPVFARRRLVVPAGVAVLGAYALFSLTSIFYWQNAPTCYVSGEGLTPFKVGVEYALMGALLLAMWNVHLRREELSPSATRWILTSLILTTASEGAFTLYVDAYGVFNALGHVFKVLSYLAIYIGLIDTGFRRPAELLFRAQERDRAALREARDVLEARVEERTRELQLEIAERTAVQERLHQSELVHRTTLEHLADAIFWANEAGEVSFVAPSAPGMLADIFGAGAASALLKQIWERPEVVEVRRGGACRTRGLELAVADSRSEERVLWIELSRVESQTFSLLVTVRDVSVRRRAQRELHQRESEWATAMEVIDDGVCLLDPSGAVLQANSVFERLLGVESAQLIGRRLCEVVHDASGTCPLCDWSTPLREGKTAWPPTDPSNPTGRSLRISQRLIEGPQGRPERALVVFRDLSWLEELHAHQEQARLIVQAVPSGIFEVEKGGGISFANTAFAKMIGVSDEAVVGADVADFVCERDRNKLPKLPAPRALGLVPRPEPLALTLLATSGREVPAQLDWDFRRNLAGEITGYIAVVTDLSERALLERRARDGARLEALGRLAGGIAHDFNNIIAPILVYTELLKASVPPASEATELLNEIGVGANRARELTAQILAFGRRSPHELRVQALSPIVEETTRFLRASLPSTIDLSLHVEPNCGEVLVDHTQVHQIVMNLCTNAAHALEGGCGAIRIALRPALRSELDERGLRAVEVDDLVCLSVADTGTGMSAEVQSHVFEPYFTARPSRDGTGLGLAVVHGIVSASGGYIDVHSRVGEGTTFRVFLPVAQPSEHVLENGAAVEPASGGHEMIMVVDDEPGMVSMLRRLLSAHGYRVRAFTSSVDALNALLQNPGAYQLLFTDQTMPDLTGLELAREALRARAGLPVVLCTGFSLQVDAEIAAKNGVKAFLHKPLSGDQILRVVRRVLDEASS